MFMRPELTTNLTSSSNSCDLGLKSNCRYVSCAQVSNSCLIGANVTGPEFGAVADMFYAVCFLQIAACTLLGFFVGFFVMYV